MNSLTEGEIAKIATQKREDGVQSLSSHFSWPDFCDERQGFHQEFVYDITMHAVTCGFSSSDVIQVAVIFKSIFPQLEGLDKPRLLSLLIGALAENLSKVTTVQLQKFTDFLTKTVITRQTLLQAVVEGAADLSITQLDLEVELPPTPCPLEQGTELHEWQLQCQKAELVSALEQKEEELRTLRDQTRVSLKKAKVPDKKDVNKEGVSASVRTAARAKKDQMPETLSREAELLRDIEEIKAQLEELDPRGARVQFL